MIMKSILAPMVEGRRSPPSFCLPDEQDATPSPAMSTANCAAICAGLSVVWAAAVCQREGWETAWASSAGRSQVHSPVVVLYQNAWLYVSS